MGDSSRQGCSVSGETRAVSRRRFISLAGASAAAISAWGFPAILSRPAFADTSWGDIGDGIMPVGPFKLLEIHCYGAPSIWENLWVTKNTDGSPNFRDFDSEMAASEWLCSLGDGTTPGSTDLVEFETDGLGNLIHWGPAAIPLLAFKNRIRMIVQQHAPPRIPVHEIAAPYAVTGMRNGDPRRAGTGAAVQHRQNSLGGPRSIPHSFVIDTGRPAGASFLYSGAMSTGRHPGGSRPLMVRLQSTAQLISRLERSQMNPSRDQLLDTLRGGYRDRLRYHAMAVDPVRSEDFSAYEAAIQSAYDAPALPGVLTTELLTIPQTAYCIKETGDADPADRPNRPGAAINLARALLTDPVNPASYVMVADTGIEGLSGGNQPCYDTHPQLVASNFEQVRATTANLFNLFSSLADAIDPTGVDPTKINLADTMIIVNAEFGRKPFAESEDGIEGRNHWPQGYVALLIGGPITSAGIAGGLDNGVNVDGAAPDSQWFSPTDLRGAALLAAGIWPFEPELFGTANFGPRINVGDEAPNAVNLVEQVLGIGGA